ncbi:hypothetical protein ABKV19_017115 [Rosa sericea]
MSPSSDLLRRPFKRPLLSDQQRRRDLSLKRQEQSRDSQLHARRVTSALLSLPPEPGASSTSQPPEYYSDLHLGAEAASKILEGGLEARKWFQKQLMLPEWMIDVPHRLTQDWFVLARSAGERCLVVSYNGTTVSRRRNGTVLHRFPSALPDGCSRTKAQPSCSILDCIFHEMDQTYYVIDMLCWRDYSLYDCTAEFRFFWLKSKLAETRACDPPSYYHRYRFSLVPWYTCDLTALHTAYTGAVPYVKDGLMFYNKHAHYQPGITPLALVWKDQNCSKYVVDTDNEGKVPSHQQIVLELQRDGKVTTSDNPPIVFGCLGLDLIQKLGTLQSGCLVRFAIGDGGLTIVDGKLERADLHYLGKSNRARAFADSYSKIMFQSMVRGSSLQIDDLIAAISSSNDGANGPDVEMMDG